MNYAFGVDVSHFHRVTSWPQLLTATCGGRPLSFFGAKATQGTTMVDSTFAQHRDGFRVAALSHPQLICAVYYHYLGGADPAAEAAHFTSTVGPIQPNERLVLDFEGDIPPSADQVFKFVAALPRHPVPLVYTSSRVCRAAGLTTWPDATVGNVDLWAPRYDNGMAEPDLTGMPWTFWRFWQFSESFSCPGIAGACDASWFNGTESDLTKYIIG